ncbi:uncharacterized protein [Eurosta solidaginis]|uniref:uncharacterized protein isoform X1 n=1 Tax=Eurosta solidaginis TaxID=178769 RepID=UPI003531723B
MVERDLAEELELTGPSDTLHLHWLGNVTTTNATERVTLHIRGHGEQYKTYEIANLYTVHDMNLPKQSFHLDRCGDKSIPRELLNLSYVNAQAHLLIGLDNAKLFRALGRPLQLSENGLIAMKTPLGWVVYGNCSEMQASVKNHLLLTRKGNKMEELEYLVHDYFANESLGISPKCAPLLSDEDKCAMFLMEATVMRRNDRFEVGLLWARDSFSFPDSFKKAKKRLEGIERKMPTDEEFAKQYIEKIDSYVKKGKLSEDEVACKSAKTFYLPHFAVRNANRKGLRIAEVDGKSLKKTLLCGPDLNQSLLSILFKFRQSPIAVCGDIREMFLQVVVREEDQQAQRFVWLCGDKSSHIDTYVMTRMVFGASCSPALAQNVKNTNAAVFKEQFPRAVEGIIEHHYVDDYVDCFETEREAVEVVKQVVEIHRTGGFELTNLVSNSEKVERELNDSSDIVKEVSVINVSRDGIERILEMYW